MKALNLETAISICEQYQNSSLKKLQDDYFTAFYGFPSFKEAEELNAKIENKGDICYVTQKAGAHNHEFKVKNYAYEEMSISADDFGCDFSFFGDEESEIDSLIYSLSEIFKDEDFDKNEDLIDKLEESSSLHEIEILLENTSNSLALKEISNFKKCLSEREKCNDNQEVLACGFDFCEIVDTKVMNFTGGGKSTLISLVLSPLEFNDNE